MADFAEDISDDRARRRLGRAIQGKGAFRRFKDELHQEYPDLLPAWYGFSDTRARRRAVEWLADNSLIHRPRNRHTIHDQPPRPRPPLSSASARYKRRNGQPGYGTLRQVRA